MITLWHHHRHRFTRLEDPKIETVDGLVIDSVLVLILGAILVHWAFYEDEKSAKSYPIALAILVVICLYLKAIFVYLFW